MTVEEFRATTPEPVRFVISGTLGSAAFWALNEACISHLLSGPSPDASPISFALPMTETVVELTAITQAWCLSYLVSIGLQFVLHSTIVYGWPAEGGYAAGLAATCEFVSLTNGRCWAWDVCR